mmetsp:Transcript_30589/g.99187  ORF Transcript_30589/g.99187 Transcript_30589/m.99187 type:complete len:205 (-) Transcript_30589:290-904(-)
MRLRYSLTTLASAFLPRTVSTPWMLPRSDRMRRLASGYCSFTATTRPESRSTARCTWPTLAVPSGSRSKLLKTSSTPPVWPLRRSSRLSCRRTWRHGRPPGAASTIGSSLRTYFGRTGGGESEPSTWAALMKAPRMRPIKDANRRESTSSSSSSARARASSDSKRRHSNSLRRSTIGMTFTCVRTARRNGRHSVKSDAGSRSGS